MKFLLILTILAILLVIPAVYAQVQYPVQELGNCASQQDCEKYCDDIQNSESCINFAEKSGMMTAEEINEARKMLPYLKAGETPGKCNSEKLCDEYCNKDENLQECIAFAEKAGLITGEELEMVKKTGGKGPGGCKGKKQCDDFCNSEANFAICVDFAVQNGMMDAKEAEIVKKTGGKGPGGCKNKEECDAFCNNEANFATCVDFSVQNGMMDAKDAEMAKKTGGKGPGNCKSKEECDAFCNNPDNQETCMNFAIEHGLLSEAELANMKKNQEFMNSDTGKCFMSCMKEAGVDSKSCGEDGTGPEACKTCGENCFPNNDNSGNCLNQEKWQQLDADCKAKGEDYYLQEVRGSDGQGGECVIDEICVQGTQPGTEKGCMDCASQCGDVPGMRSTGTDCVDNQCKCYYEAIEEQPQTGGDGGCTQPGPEGQCNPRPGAEPGPGSEGESGEQISGGSSEGSDYSGSSGGDSGGESGALTGAVIMRVNSDDGVIMGLFEYLRNLFL